MFNLDQKKQKVFNIILLCLISLFLISLIIINFDSFAAFFSMIGEKISVLNSVFIGIIIAYLLNPIEIFFRTSVFKKVKSNKAHKALSILCTYILIIGLISAFFLIAVPQVVKSINEMPAKLHDFALEATEWLEKKLIEVENSEFFASIMESFDIEELDIEKIMMDFGGNLVDMENLLQTIADSSLKFLENTYIILKDMLIGFILSIYLLAAKERILANGKKIVMAVAGEKRGNSTMNLLKFTNKTFGGFIQGKLINAVIIGILTWIAFVIFKVAPTYAPLLAIIIAITDLIPVFGPFIGAVPCAFIVLIAAPEKLIIMILLIIIIQQVDGNYIGPKILGESTGLSALGVFLAIIIMGGYFGIAGMLIGVPTFAVISALIQKTVDRRLSKNGLSTDISDYYSKHSLEEDESQGKRTLFARTVDFFAKYFKIAILAVVEFFKKLPKIRRRQAPDSSETSEEQNSESK